jgi:uncharacterized cupin superfamily protein
MAQTDRSTGLVGHTGIKQPARAATTANITLSGEQTIDGVACVTGDRVLVKNQTTASENGVWVVDTGAWSRAKDFNGTYDIVNGTMIRVNEGSVNADALFIVDTADPLTIGTTSLVFSRLAINYLVKSSHVATAGQTVFTLSTTYQVGANNLAVYVDGIHQTVDDEYLETNASQITFTYALEVGQKVDCYAGQAIGNLTAALAALVAIVDTADLYIATTVEGALAERADQIAVDVGNADATLIYGASNSIQRWNTALTANRTATLSTTNAKEGARFRVVRGAGATGAFSLAVGSLATLWVPGEWAEVTYDAGTAAWVLTGYGILSSAELRTMSADNGDASATLTIGSSARTQRWGTPLTAERTATLSATGAYAGARFRIERLEAATGGFALSVLVGTAVLARLAYGQWCDVEHTGTTWVVTARGNLREPFNSLISVREDFLGEEIDGYKWQSLIGTDAECRQAIVLADQIGGVVRLTTGDDAAASMAVNGVQLQGQLNWRADRGVMEWEARVALDDITTVALFIGLTDQRAVLEMPFTMGAGDALTSNATNAVGVVFDTGADIDNWWMVGVKADVDAAKQNSAVAPGAGTFDTWRIEVDGTGIATFYRNGTLIGTAMAAAVTGSAPLVPVVAAFSRAAASRNIDVDLLSTQSQR